MECTHAVHGTVADPGRSEGLTQTGGGGVIVWNACTRFTIQWRIQGVRGVNTDRGGS